MTTNRERAVKIENSFTGDGYNIYRVKEIERALNEAVQDGTKIGYDLGFEKGKEIGRREMRERAAKVCEDKIECLATGHDDRWCTHCESMKDAQDVMQTCIRALPIEGDHLKNCAINQGDVECTCPRALGE